jgi:hypothetical protein
MDAAHRSNNTLIDGLSKMNSEREQKTLKRASRGDLLFDQNNNPVIGEEQEIETEY